MLSFGQPDRLGVRPVVADDGQHRPEDLLLRYPHVVAGVHEHGGLVEVASWLVRRPFPADQHARALGHAGPDELVHAVAMGRPDQRPERRRLVPRIADAHVGEGLVHAVDVGLAEPFGQQQPALQHAALPAVRQDVGEADGRRVGLGHVAEHDPGALAAQFQLDPLDRARGAGHDPPAGRGRAGERDDVDHRAAGQPAPGLGPAGHHVEHACRHAGVGGGAGNLERV